MQIDGNGCRWVLWVLWGAGARGDIKNKASRVKNGRTGHVFDPMAGGIFPEHHVLHKKKGKGARTAPDGYTWVCISAVGLIFTGGAEKQGETRQKSM